MKTEALTSLHAESNFKAEKVKNLTLNGSFAFEILVKSIYTNPVQTSIQEYISNARDAHRRVGKDASTIEIELPTHASPTFVVRDYGCSISPEKMDALVIVVGDSDKRATNQETGGYGIGFKSGFAITNNFITETFHEGVHRIYNLRYDENGQAICELLTSVPTTEEDGVKVSIPIKGEYIQAARKAVARAICVWSEQPKLNILPHQLNELLPSIKEKLIYEDDKILILENVPVNHPLYPYAKGATTAVLFPVIYDGIPNKTPFESNEVIPGIDKTDYIHVSNARGYIFFKASVDDIRQGPSREAFVVNKDLHAWYKKRLQHTEEVLQTLVLAKFKTGNFREVEEGLDKATNIISSKHLIEHLFNETFIKKQKPKLAGKYEIKELKWASGTFSLTLSHGPISDSVFPYVYYRKEDGVRRRSREKNVHAIYTNLCNLKNTNILPSPHRNFKIPVYADVYGGYQEFDYVSGADKDRYVGIFGTADAGRRVELLPHEDNLEHLIVCNDENLKNHLTKLSLLSAPYHPLIESHTVTETTINANGEEVSFDRTKYTEIPRRNYTDWIDSEYFPLQKNTLVWYSEIQYLIGNSQEEREAPKKYQRKLKQTFGGYYPSRYLIVDQHDINAEVKKDLIEIFGAKVISDEVLPIPAPRVKLATKKHTFYVPGFNSYDDTFKRVSCYFEQEVSKDIVLDLVEMLENSKGISSYCFYNLEEFEDLFKNYIKCNPKLEVLDAEGNKVEERDKAMDMRKAYLHFSQLAEKFGQKYYALSSTAYKLFRKNLKTLPERIETDLKISFLSDEIGEIECTEESFNKVLNYMAKNIPQFTTGGSVGKGWKKQVNYFILINAISKPVYHRVIKSLPQLYNVSIVEWLNVLKNHPYFSPLAVLSAHSIFLMPSDFFSTGDSTLNEDWGNPYVLKHLNTNFKVAKTYDQFIVEELHKVLSEINPLLLLFEYHSSDKFLGETQLTKQEYLNLLPKESMLEKVQAILKEAKKYPLFTENFERIKKIVPDTEYKEVQEESVRDISLSEKDYARLQTKYLKQINSMVDEPALVPEGLYTYNKYSNNPLIFLNSTTGAVVEKLIVKGFNLQLLGRHTKVTPTK